MAPFRVVPGNRPANGFGTFAVNRLMVAWSRFGDVLRKLLRREVQAVVDRQAARLVVLIGQLQHLPAGSRCWNAGGVATRVVGPRVGIVEGHRLSEVLIDAAARCRPAQDAVGKGLDSVAYGLRKPSTVATNGVVCAEPGPIHADDAVRVVEDAEAAAEHGVSARGVWAYRRRRHAARTGCAACCRPAPRWRREDETARRVELARPAGPGADWRRRRPAQPR